MNTTDSLLLILEHDNFSYKETINCIRRKLKWKPTHENKWLWFVYGVGTKQFSIAGQPK